MYFFLLQVCLASIFEDFYSEPKYEINFKQPENTLPDAITISNYKCVIPKAKTPSKPKEIDLEYYKSKLTSMPCMSIIIQFWEFSICNMVATQKHTPESINRFPPGTLTKISYNLGHESNQNYKLKIQHDGSFQFEKYFGGGDMCYTGRNRESIVRFICDSREYLEYQKEDPDCVYWFFIHTPKMCNLMQETLNYSLITCFLDDQEH
jgi:hypothetical protein